MRNFLTGKKGGARLWAVLTLALLMFAWWRTTLWYRDQQITEKQLETASEVSLQGNALSEAINRRFALLRGLHAFVLTEYNQEDFGEQIARFTSTLYSKTSGIRNILLAPNGVVSHVYPDIGNEDLIGVNLLQILQPDVKDDIQLALETEEIVIGFPLDYAQEGWGLAARQALYLEDGSFWGLIGIVLDMPALLSDSGLENESYELDYSLLDNDKNVIYETKSSDNSMGISFSLEFPKGETWELVGYPKEDWDTAVQQNLLPIQISGLVIVLLVTGLVYIFVSRQAHLSNAVQQRTQEIARINRSLEQKVSERTRELASMLEVSQNVASMPDLQPLLSLILDRLQEIVPCNSVSILLLDSDHNLVLRNYHGPLNLEDIPPKWSLEGADHYQAVMKQGKPVIVPDVWADSNYARTWRQSTESHLGFVPDYIACWMGIPLAVKNHVLGLLVLHHEETGFFNEESALLALAFSNQAALAIENARLYEQAQQFAVLRERQRIARELHDSVSQALYSIGLGARTAKTLIEQSNEDALKPLISEPIMHILSTAEAGLSEMRALIFELRPEMLEKDGLIVALRKQIEANQRRNDLAFEANLCAEPDISFDLKLLVFRLAQECIHNIVKHAKARNVRLDLRYDKERLEFFIHDDGHGFDVSFPGQGLGLRSMR